MAIVKTGSVGFSAGAQTRSPIINANKIFNGDNSNGDSGTGHYSSNEQYYNSYSGADIVAQIVVPGSKPLVLGELQTISYSMHRENTPVRHLGHVFPKGFVKGGRMLAGSMIFTVFNYYAFYRLENMQKAIYSGLYPVADMLPPFDIIITMANEYGSISKLRIFGVTIVDEGGTMSVDDLIIESTYSYMARGIQPMTGYDYSRAASAVFTQGNP